MVVATEVESQIEAIPSVKDLASSEPSLRRKNLQQIISHLEERSGSRHLTHTQALQLWRGFHVALYMHDSKNQLSVQTLIATLASTLRLVRRKDIELASTTSREDKPDNLTTAKSSNGPTSTASDMDEDDFAGFDDETSNPEPQSDHTWLATYTTAFWETIAREWSSIDQWRMNKYLLLIRFVLREIFSISIASYFGLEAADSNQQGTEQDIFDEAAAEKISKTKKRKGASDSKDESSQTKRAKKSKPSKSSTMTSVSEAQTTSGFHPDASVSRSQLAILKTWPLSPRERKVSDGLRLHVLDIYLDELFIAIDTVKSKHNPESDIDNENLVTLLKNDFLGPLQNVAADGLARHVRTKAKEVLTEFDERVKELKS